MFKSASTVSDTEVEVQPLWEYPGVSLSASHQLISFDLTTVVPQSEVEVRGTITTTVSGTCHGVALWLDVHLDSHTVVSTGPQSSPQPGQESFLGPLLPPRSVLLPPTGTCHFPEPLRTTKRSSVPLQARSLLTLLFRNSIHIILFEILLSYWQFLIITKNMFSRLLRKLLI
ncbi:protein arginine N-methyltransferase 7-like [Homalodisca vitripennis]|uniref:protein arginine N-methyltransferase 7-like n=1 Tax=Homalodisca vitripennis TaxID=197043 RepID=UPI001EECC022|nr:protein arginine N-methyltransferase 7-like [Homalodisca vitripennis]